VNNSYLFISDIHLGLQDKDTEKKKERLLVNFLEFANSEAKELFILGDLFDFWFEYGRVYQKGFYRTLTALSDLAEKNIKIHYIIGNHDFLHRDFFGTEFGAILYQEALDINLDRKRFFLAHGDGLVKNDMGYKILKKVLRNPLLQKCYSFIHPDLGIAIASRTSRSSRDYTSKRSFGEQDGLFETAKQKLEEGYDYVIFGHSHSRIITAYNNGCYINLGSWLEKPCYGVFNNGLFKIVDLNYNE